MTNEIYQLYESTAIYHKVKAKFCEKLFKQLFPSFKAGDTIVEIGPGQGHFAFVCQEKGINYIGLEPSKTLRGELNKKGINVAASWVPPIPVKGKSCDMVYACIP